MKHKKTNTKIVAACTAGTLRSSCWVAPTHGFSPEFFQEPGTPDQDQSVWSVESGEKPSDYQAFSRRVCKRTRMITLFWVKNDSCYSYSDNITVNYQSHLTIIMITATSRWLMTQDDLLIVGGYHEALWSVNQAWSNKTKRGDSPSRCLTTSSSRLTSLVAGNCLVVANMFAGHDPLFAALTGLRGCENMPATACPNMPKYGHVFGDVCIEIVYKQIYTMYAQ